MSRSTLSLLALAFACSMGLHAFSADNARQTLKGWGEVIDPDGDCRVALEGDRLTISIPPARHDLSIEVGDVNAPRILRPIDGDFIAQVKVSGNVRHAGGRTSDHYLAYHGGGLLLWQDDRNYLRLERAAVNDPDGAVIHYANFELREDGQRVDTEQSAMEIPDRDTYLRLERRGGRVFASTSEDGVQWHAFQPLTVDLRKEIRLGLSAINTSTERFKAVFSELEVFKRETIR
jgi:regulation of enolase protein 1 (concanavalin A-like superfamily)